MLCQWLNHRPVAKSPNKQPTYRNGRPRCGNQCNQCHHHCGSRRSSSRSPRRGRCTMLVSILGSPCVCHGERREETALLIALSPFSPLGSAWVIGNSMLCVVFVTLHGLTVFLKTRGTDHRSQRHKLPKSQTVATLIGRWLHVAKRSRDRRDLLKRRRFPNLSVTLLLFLVPGVVRAVVDTAVEPGVVRAVVDTAVEVSADSDAPVYAALAVGATFVVCAFVFLDVVAYSHADAEAVMPVSSTSEALKFFGYQLNSSMHPPCCPSRFPTRRVGAARCSHFVRRYCVLLHITVAPGVGGAACHQHHRPGHACVVPDVHITCAHDDDCSTWAAVPP